MIKGKVLIVILISIFILVGCNDEGILYKNGIYEGVGQGHHGPIKVKVTVEENRIVKVDIIEHQETPYLCDIVYEKLPKKIIKRNSTDVEVVAGATFTSNGLIQAINNALRDAKIEEME